MLLQLRDCLFAVADKKNKIEISEVFCTELKFATDCLLKWFNKEFKSNNLELSNGVKRKYEVGHPINRINWTLIEQSDWIVARSLLSLSFSSQNESYIVWSR